MASRSALPPGDRFSSRKRKSRASRVSRSTRPGFGVVQTSKSRARQAAPECAEPQDKTAADQGCALDRPGDVHGKADDRNMKGGSHAALEFGAAVAGFHHIKDRDFFRGHSFPPDLKFIEQNASFNGIISRLQFK